MQDHGAKA